MSLAAVDAVDDAIDATKHFLLPFEKWTWLRLAFVLFFVGGGGGGLSYLQSFGQFASDAGDGSGGFGGSSMALVEPLVSSVGTALQVTPEGFSPSELGLGIAGLVLVAAIIVLVFLLIIVGPIMQFVFVEALITEAIHVRRYFVGNFWNGIQLLFFQIGLFALALIVGGALVVGGLAAQGYPLDPTVATGAAIGLGFLALVPLGIVFGTIGGFTTVFAVPIMLATDVGILSAWGKLWGAIKAEPKEYFVYLVLSIVLGIGVSLVAGFLGLFALLIIGISFAAVGFAMATLTSGLAMAILVGVVVTLFVLTMLLVTQLIRVPLFSFLRYYAIFVLGDTDESLDPIPELRAEIRS